MKSPLYFGPPPEQVTGRHPALIVLVCGPSYAGKTHACEHVIVPRLGASYRGVEQLYSEAAVQAGMTGRTDDPHDPTLVRARTRARERKWQDGEASLFFAAYEQLVGEAIRGAPGALVLDGATLSRKEEAEIVLATARKVHGPSARLVRLLLTPTYEQWLANRIRRQASLGVTTEKIANLIEPTYQKRIEAAAGPGLKGIVELRVTSRQELERIVGGFTSPRSPA